MTFVAADWWWIEDSLLSSSFACLFLIWGAICLKKQPTDQRKLSPLSQIILNHCPLLYFIRVTLCKKRCVVQTKTTRAQCGIWCLYARCLRIVSLPRGLDDSLWSGPFRPGGWRISLLMRPRQMVKLYTDPSVGNGYDSWHPLWC